MFSLYLSFSLFGLFNILNLNQSFSQTTITIGAQTTQSGTSGASPYNYAWESRRVQFVYTKAEIDAAGGFAGAISAIAWDVSEINSGSLLNYTIRLAHTTATDASSHNAASLTTVKNAHTLTAGSTGWRTIAFDSNFNWNGTDNLLVDVCWGVNSGYGYNGQVYMYNNVANQTISVYSTSANQCGTSTSTTRNYKPRVQLTIGATCNAPIATITKTCATDFASYSLAVNVTDLGDATGVDITDGTTTYETNVGLGTYTISGLTTGKTIYVQDNADVACKYSEAFAICNICTDAPSLPTDECADAPLIDLTQPFAGSTSCSYTASAGSPSGCGTIENDSWMTFIAASSDVEIEFQVGTCSSGYGIQLVVFSGSCGSLSELAGSCVNPASDGYNSGTTSSWIFSGLTIGNTYYIRIDGYAGDLCDYWFTPISGVVITPANDLCADAMTLACGGSDIASNILATATDAPTACSGGGTTSKGVWYTFTGTGQEVIISTDNAGTNFDTDINIFSGSCGSLSCIGGDTDSGTGTTSSYTFTATNAVTYFIYVDGNGATEGQFEISLTCTGCNANAGSWN